MIKPKNVILLFLCLLVVNKSFGKPNNFSSLPKKKQKNNLKLESTFDVNRIVYNYRYILNNKTSFEKEKKKLEKFKNSFEKNFLISILYKKEMRFDKVYGILNGLLNQKTNHLFYYDELTYSARANNKLKYLSNSAKKLKNDYKYYLLSLINYSSGDYEKSLKNLRIFIKNKRPTSKVYYKLSYIYRNLGNYPKAFEALKKAEKLAVNNMWMADQIMLAKGSLYFLSGKYNKALSSYKKGLKIAVKIKDKQTKATAIVNISIINDMSGNVEKARKGFSTAIKIAKEIGSNEINAFAHSEKGVSFTFTNEMLDAREEYLESYDIYKLTGNNYRLSLISNNIGKIYMQVFEYKSAIKYYKDGIKYAGSNKRSKAMNLLGIADAYTNLSNYSKALDFYNKAEKISSQIKELSLSAEINSGFGSLNYNINNLNNALEYYKKSINFYNKANDTFSSTDLYQKVGRVYLQMNLLSKAEESYNKAIKLSKKNNDVYYQSLSTLDIAEIYFRQNKYDYVHKILESIKPIIFKNNIEYLKARLFVLKGNTSIKEKYYKNAIKYFLTSLRIGKELNENGIKINSLFGLAKTYEHKNNLKLAENYYSKSYKLIKLISDPLFKKETLQISFFSGLNKIYSSYTNLLLKQNKVENAFELIDNVRSRNTKQILNNLKLLSLIKDETKLNRLLDYSWMLNSSVYSKKQIDSISIVFNNFKNNLIKEVPQIRKYLINKDKLLSEIQKNLDDNENIISLYTTKDKSYLFRITNNKFIYNSIDLSESEIKKLLKNISPFYNSKIENIKTFNQDLFSFNSEAAYTLYHKVFSSIIENIPKGQKIIFSTSFNIQSFPIEFLITKYSKEFSSYNYSNKNFLLYDYSISYTSSAHTYIEQKNNSIKNNGKVLVVGNPFVNLKNDEFAVRRSLFSKTAGFLPLKYSLQEIDEIKNIISVDRTLEGKKATETEFKQNAGNSKLIHLSTHSFLYKKQPVIFFSNVEDKKNDGFLELNEIVGLNLNSDLVVLSSCNSGLGKVDKSEGVLGMTKAFFEAGSKSVVVSLWEVNDKYTSILMKYFYTFLSSGKNKSEALKLAKIKFIKNNSANPYFWSSFILSGNSNTIELNKGNSIKIFVYFILAIIVLLLLLLSLKLNKRKRSAV